MWYTDGLHITGSRLYGIKALREAKDTVIESCVIASPEFGWKCRGIRLADSILESEYPFLASSGIDIERLRLKGKYSFQYVKNVNIKNSVLDTKDAFWHCENVTVEDSVVSGQYPGWYSKNLRFVRCHITGTQPLCYCEGLELIDCTMEDTDLSFERSVVNAGIRGNILSVKNPAPGSNITADSIGEIIIDEYGSAENIRIVTNNSQKQET